MVAVYFFNIENWKRVRGNFLKNIQETKLKYVPTFCLVSLKELTLPLPNSEITQLWRAQLDRFHCALIVLWDVMHYIFRFINNKNKQSISQEYLAMQFIRPLLIQWESFLIFEWEKNTKLCLPGFVLPPNNHFRDGTKFPIKKAHQKISFQSWIKN